MIYLSASLIKDVLQCTKRAYWRKNFPELAQQTPPQELGLTLHTCLEENWDKSLEDMVKSLPKTDVVLENKDLIYIFLKNYVNYFKQYCNPDDKMEEKFSLPIDNYVIVGKLDRVNSKTGLVLDWKTSKDTPFSIDNDIQFILYDWAFEKLYGKRANLVGFASLKTGKLVRYRRNEKYIEELFSVLIPRVIKILEINSYSRDGMYDYLVGKYSVTCKNCAFKKECLK